MSDPISIILSHIKHELYLAMLIDFSDVEILNSDSGFASSRLHHHLKLNFRSESGLSKNFPPLYWQNLSAIILLSNLPWHFIQRNRASASVRFCSLSSPNSQVCICFIEFFRFQLKPLIPALLKMWRCSS